MFTTCFPKVCSENIDIYGSTLSEGLFRNFIDFKPAF